MNLIGSESWNEFLINVRIAKKDLGNPEILWYWGHWNSNHYLLPTLLRYKNGLEKEKVLFHKFRVFADKVFKTKESEWETLFDMQHYGIPTRLLNWTESFGIALYFTSYYNNLKGSSEDASLYLLNPLELNKISGKTSILRIPREESDFSYTSIYWNNKPFKVPTNRANK